MSYFTRAEIELRIPPAYLKGALDDDGDGAEDPGLYDALAEQADGAVDALLEGRFAVPFATAPRRVREAALVFACEMLYARKGVGANENPWTKRAETEREALAEIAAGNAPLEAESAEDLDGGAVLTEDARTYDASGRVMV